MNWKEESIKTRIETQAQRLTNHSENYWKEESIKTRIETQIILVAAYNQPVLKRRIH